MNQEEFIRLRQQIIDEENQFYINHPDVGAWVRLKRMIYRVIVIYWIVHSVLSIAVMIQMQNVQFVMVGMEILKLFIQLLILTVVISPKGGWKPNLFLYFYFATNLYFLIRNGALILATLPYILIAPSYSLLVVMEATVPFLLLGIAIFYTVPAKHRRLSELSEANRQSMAQKMQQLTRNYK